MIKNLKTVADYNKRNVLRMFRFSCFNDASMIIASRLSRSEILDFNLIKQDVFALANILYKEGVDKDYFELNDKENLKQNFDFNN